MAEPDYSYLRWWFAQVGGLDAGMRLLAEESRRRYGASVPHVEVASGRVTRHVRAADVLAGAPQLDLFGPRKP